MSEVHDHFRVVKGSLKDLYPEDKLEYVGVFDYTTPLKPDQIMVVIPVSILIPLLSGNLLRAIAKRHHVVISIRRPIAEVASILEQHVCEGGCRSLLSILRRPPSSEVNPFKLAVYTISEMKKLPCVTHEDALFQEYLDKHPPQNEKLVHLTKSVIMDEDEGQSDAKNMVNDTVPITENTSSVFPPRVHPTPELVEFVKEWTQAVSEQALAEDVCGCCGHLVKHSCVQYVAENDPMLQTLAIRENQFDDSDSPILCDAGIISDGDKKKVILCATCFNGLTHK